MDLTTTRRARAAEVGPVDHDSAWSLDPSVTFLNHGSCGACPRAVLQAQQVWRDRMEAEPIDFLGRQLPGLMDSTRSTLAAFVGADPDDLAFVSNATAGVSTILRSVCFRPGDELLANNHEYNASLNALRFAAERDGARVVIAQIPFPIRDPGQVIEAILARVTPRTKLVLISHVTSPTGVVFPIAELVRELARQEIDTLIDGAHAPGMLPLALDDIGAAYYTGNGHKWLCAPKGSAFLHVRKDRQAHIRPLAISHGANDSRTDQSRFRLEFDVVATMDPTPFLAMSTAIQFMGSLMPGGWRELMESNRALARAGRDRLAQALGVDVPVSDEMLGSMAMVPLPGLGSPRLKDTGARIHEALFREHHIEVPIYEWPTETVREAGSASPACFVRISAQRYNNIRQYAALADALVKILGA